jgi:hypothetical protein
MKKSIYFLFFFLACLFVLPSCDDDSEGGGNCTTLANQILDLVGAVEIAADEYDADPSAANCQNYKDELQKFLNKSKQFRKCVPDDDLPDYNDALDLLEFTIDHLP